MLAFLHFEQISSVEVVTKVKKSPRPSQYKDAYIEVLFIRHELAVNFVWYNSDTYDSIGCLLDWENY